MDVVLLAATAGLTTYVPRRFFGKGAPTAVALGLSLSLFSLSLAELLPTAWLVWLEHGGSYWSISGAYRWILWAMTVLCTVVIPCASGTHFFARRQQAAAAASAATTNMAMDREEEKKRRSFTATMGRHWLLRLVYRLISIALKVVTKAFYYVVISPIGRLLSYGRSRCRLKMRSALPMHSLGEEKKRSFCFRNPLRSPMIRFLRDADFRRSVILGSLFGTTIAGVALFCISRVVIEPSDSFRPLRTAVSWLCSVGILLSAIMNGFGSVSLPYECLGFLFLEPVSPKAITNAEVELENTRARLEEKINAMEADVVSLPSVSPEPKSIWRWRRGVRRKFSEVADEHTIRRKQALKEVEFIETLVVELHEDVEEMRYSQTVWIKARSASGRIRAWIGVVFSVVLLVRLLFAVTSVTSQFASGIIQHKAFGVDPVTRITLWLFGHHVVEESDLHTMSQFMSLILTAFLSVSQMRTFLRTATTVQRRAGNLYRKLYCKPRICSRSTRREVSATLSDGSADQTDEWFFSHATSALMCCYCLACLVLTKMMLPHEYRASFSTALGAEESQELFTIRTFAVDVAFSSTAILSAAIFTIMLAIMRSNSRRYGSLNNVRQTSLLHVEKPKNLELLEP